MNKVFAAALTLLLTVAGNAHATLSNPYSYTPEDLQTFSLQQDAPGGSAQAFYGIFPDGTFTTIWDRSNTGGTAYIGASGTKDLSAFDGISLNITNSSFAPISAALYVVEDAMIYIGSIIELDDNETGIMKLAFGGPSQSTTMDDQYGFFTAQTTGYMTHAKVPEPATIAMMGLGLIGLGFMARRRNS